MCLTLLCNFNCSGVRLFAHSGVLRVSQKSKIWFLLLIGLFTKFQNFKEFLNNKISIWCLWHYYITSIVQKSDFRHLAEIYIQSAPNNSSETYTFMCWAEWAILGSAKTALKFKYENQIGQHIYNSVYGAVHKLEK